MLDDQDHTSNLRDSDLNPEVIGLYQNFIGIKKEDGTPDAGNHTAHALLHTEHHALPDGSKKPMPLVVREFDIFDFVKVN